MNPDANMNAIPPELIDLIVDCLQDDIPSLRSCSLVSHTFLPRSRVHLFRSITIRRPKQAHSCATFRSLLSHAPWMKRLVRSLSIHAEPGFPPSDSGLWDGDSTQMNELVEDLFFITSNDQQWICTDPHLPQILEALPNLRSINLNTLKWRTADTDMYPSWENAVLRTGLRSLRLDYVEMDTIPRLLSLLQSFPDLKVLTLGVIMSASHPVRPFPVTHMISLDELDINMEGSGRVAELLVKSSGLVDWAQLKKLRVSRCFTRQIELTRSILRKATSLEELEVGECVLPTSLDCAQLQCSPLGVHSLKHLIATITSASSLQWWMVALTSGTSSRLEMITFNAKSSQNFEQWCGLGDVLDHEKFSRLRSVDLMFPSQSRGFADHLQRALRAHASLYDPVTVHI